MTRRCTLFSLAAIAAGGLFPLPARAQETVTPEVALTLAPPEVRYTVRAADSILTTPDGGISLESFRGDTVTGVYLRGLLGGRAESVGYGLDPGSRRYLWLSVGRGDSLEYVAMLFDVDGDLTPEFLLFRTVDHGRRIESATEYRAPGVDDGDLDITFQPACAAPRCDPSTWTLRPREQVVVPAHWFIAWRPVFGLAAMRGERWIGEPVTALHAVSPPETP
ncbi:MAG TPA: hypothetical protein VM737_07860 [Gemmatimonadota bacterium]|nr:hypothetical protein [Gemmatimonadota bacterium]